MSYQDEYEDKWTSDGQALRHLRSRGYVVTKGFFFVHPDRIEPNEKDLSAFAYLFFEWDYGDYMAVPPKKCESRHVAQDGSCLYCQADNAEVCRAVPQ